MKTNKWLEHVKAVRRKYPNKSLQECLVLAKKTYKK